ncbi:MAG: VOC family protein [Polyangia bacterium]
MAWTRSHPLFPANDVAASIKWYADVCGWNATLVHEGLHGLNYAVLHRDKISIHLVRAAEAQHGIKPPAQAQFWVDEGFEEIFENAKRLGVRILESIKERPWGHRDFLLADPDGNVVWITQVVASQGV